MTEKSLADIFYEHALMRYKPNWFLKLIGFKGFEQSSIEFKWGYISKRFGFKFYLIEWDTDCEYDHTWSITFPLIFASITFYLPKWLPKRHFNKSGESDLKKWGCYSGDDFSDLCFCWGFKHKYVNMPWQLTFHRYEVLMKDGTWKAPPSWGNADSGISREEFDKDIATEEHPYKYLLNNGTFQHRTATIHVSEMEWRRRFLKHIPVFRKIRRTIEVEFSEKTGSWKGGCIGCNFEMKLDELPYETLRRMERTRKF